MSQMSFADAEYAGKRKKTRREVFLQEMDQVIPWVALVKLIEPFYPVAGQGRRPYPLESMLRVHLMQNFFTLSDPAMEEALYDSASMRQFAGFKLSGAIPDETTILNFRHLLEEYDLAEDMLAQVNKLLAAKGLLLKRGPHHAPLRRECANRPCRAGTTRANRPLRARPGALRTARWHCAGRSANARRRG